MKFDSPLTTGTLIRRYKRFLADIELDSGEVITAHCPNTGRMTTCAEPGYRVALSKSDNPKRKYAYTWELAHNGTCWIGVNTARTNALAAEAIETGIITELQGYDELLREQPFGKSRLDLLLKKGAEHCYVEVKNVTLVMDDGCYAFPDAVTARGTKHLHELIDIVQAGHRAVMLFVVQRADGTTFRPAHEIDPSYTEALQKADDSGVKILVYQSELSPTRAQLVRPVKMAPLNSE